MPSPLLTTSYADPSAIVVWLPVVLIAVPTSEPCTGAAGVVALSTLL